jgi:hypothetical protein
MLKFLFVVANIKSSCIFAKEIKQIEIMSIRFLTSEEKKESLKNLSLRRNKLLNDLFLAKLYKKDKFLIQEKLSILDKDIQCLKDILERPIYL